MTVCSVVLCVCCQSVLLVVLVGGLSLVHGLSSRSFCCKVRMIWWQCRRRWLLMCVVWHSGRGVCVERYVIGGRECLGNQFTRMVICV